VITQRLVVERTAAVDQDWHSARSRRGPKSRPKEERERGRGRSSAGIELEPVDTHEADEEARKFGTAQVDYIYEQPAEELFATA
jgi:F-type H+-transporting ATPase subunit gamma